MSKVLEYTISALVLMGGPGIKEVVPQLDFFKVIIRVLGPQDFSDHGVPHSKNDVNLFTPL